MKKYLESCIEILDCENLTGFKKFADLLHGLINEVDKLISKNFSESDSDATDDDSLQNTVLDQLPNTKRRKTAVSKRTALVSALDSVQDSCVQALIKKIVLTLDSFFTQYLKHYTTVLWHEIVYFSNYGRIQKAFNPSTRLVIHSAITSPGHFLGTSDSFDITILYKLYLECGRLINLYDWFIAFKSVIDPESQLSERQVQ